MKTSRGYKENRVFVVDKNFAKDEATEKRENLNQDAEEEIKEGFLEKEENKEVENEKGSSK